MARDYDDDEQDIDEDKKPIRYDEEGNPIDDDDQDDDEQDDDEDSTDELMDDVERAEERAEKLLEIAQDEDKSILVRAKAVNELVQLVRTTLSHLKGRVGELLKFIREEQRLIPKIKLLKNSVEYDESKIILKPTEHRDLNKAKKHKKFKDDVKTIKKCLHRNRIVFITKTIGPMLPVIGIVLLVLVCIIAVVAFIYMLFPWLFGGSSGGNSGMSSLDGIKADAFYGARMIYKNEEEARKEILTNYTEIVSEVSGQVTAANERVQITITLPEQSVYDEFNEQTFETDYHLLYNLFNDFSNLVLEYDAGEGETFAFTTLTEKLDAIKYFGIDSDLATTGTNNFALILSSMINDNDLYSIDTSDSSETLDPDAVENLISTKAVEVLSDESKYNARTEKYFVKDYILSGEDGLKEIAKQNYVAVIFMPKRAVTFTKFSFIVADAQIEDLNSFITIDANGQVINLTGEIFNEADGDMPAAYIFESAEVNVSVQAYTDFSEDGAATEATSLLKIATSDTLNAEQFLTAAEDNTTIKTYKESGVVIEFNSDVPFMFAENETKYG